jgi:hypothetical protein
MSTGDLSGIDSALRVGQLIVFAIGIGAVLWRLSGLATKLEVTGQFQAVRMDKIELALDKLSNVVITQAAEKTRLDNQESAIAQLRDDIRLLREGRGFIRERIEGEWPKT